MIHAQLSTTSVLDESAEVVSLVAAPWAGLLIATSIPYRFLQCVFADQLFEAGSDAMHHGRALGTTANLAIAAFVVSLLGRAIFARACRLAAARGAAPGREAFRIRPASLAAYLFTGTLAELLFYATLMTCLGTFFSAIFSGLAIGTMELNEEASVRGPVRLIARYGREIRIISAIVLVFVCAIAVALVNVAATFSFTMWLSDALLGIDLGRWKLLFSNNNRRFVLGLIAGAWIAIEPFWIAANVALVRKAGAAETGEDLRAWFEELRQAP